MMKCEDLMDVACGIGLGSGLNMVFFRRMGNLECSSGKWDRSDLRNEPAELALGNRRSTKYEARCTDGP